MEGGGEGGKKELLPLSLRGAGEGSGPPLMRASQTIDPGDADQHGARLSELRQSGGCSVVLGASCCCLLLLLPRSDPQRRRWSWCADWHQRGEPAPTALTRAPSRHRGAPRTQRRGGGQASTGGERGRTLAAPVFRPARWVSCDLHRGKEIVRTCSFRNGAKGKEDDQGRGRAPALEGRERERGAEARRRRRRSWAPPPPPPPEGATEEQTLNRESETPYTTEHTLSQGHSGSASIASRVKSPRRASTARTSPGARRQAMPPPPAPAPPAPPPTPPPPPTPAAAPSP